MTHSAIPFKENKHQCLELIGNRTPALFSDFDGTLSELNTDPRKAFIDSHCLSTIKRLRLKLPAVAIISGRMATDVRSRVGLDKITYIGNHGAEQNIKRDKPTLENIPTSISLCSRGNNPNKLTLSSKISALPCNNRTSPILNFIFSRRLRIGLL